MKLGREKHLTRLHQILTMCFNKGELLLLCVRLGIDYYGLPGEEKANKVKELIAYLERHGRISEIVGIGKQLRPDISWDGMPEVIEGVSPVSQFSPKRLPISKSIIVLVPIVILILAFMFWRTVSNLDLFPASTYGNTLSPDNSAGRTDTTNIPGDEYVEDDVTVQSNTGENDVGGQSETIYVQLDSSTEGFSISTSHHTTPEDVLREVSFSGMPGGPPCLHDDSFEHPTLWFLDDFKYLEWQERILICMGGWEPDEKVRFTIESSDGRIAFEKLLSADADGGIVTSYSPDINTPLGLYTLNLEGGSGGVQQSISIKPPTEPRLYEYEDKLILYNFQPNERVRVFAYELTYSLDKFRGYHCDKLVAWHEFQVNTKGQLILQPGENTDSTSDYVGDRHYVVVGNLSGEVHIFPFRIGHSLVGPILSPYSITVFRPAEQDLQNVGNLWDLATYRDLKHPGTQTYSVTVHSTDKWRWGFSWCAIDTATLREIFRPLSIEFFIDGIKLATTSPQMITYDDTASNGWACERWSTILTNWPSNGRVELEIRYSLEESIYNGNESYPPGEYRQVITVDVD